MINGGNGTSLVPVRGNFLQELLVGNGTGIPVQMIWTILIALAVWFFLNHTRRALTSSWWAITWTAPA